MSEFKKSKLEKVGRVMVPNGIYRTADGVEKKRWHEIGIALATPHHSQICIKLHANGFGEGQFATIFYDEDKKPHFVDRGTMTADAVQAQAQAPVQEATSTSYDDEVDFSDVPF